jgi:guanyl-specific ribonuclease Sa
MRKLFLSKLTVIILVLAFALSSAGCYPAVTTSSELTEQNESFPSGAVQSETVSAEAVIAENGIYTAPQDVADYLRIYQQLPVNYLTKREAAALGWESEKGNLWEVTDHASIGGDVFGNREGLLPDKPGRTWFECDVNYYGGYRGAERIVYSSDGLIYYTKDHYQSFEKIYP